MLNDEPTMFNDDPSMADDDPIFRLLMEYRQDSRDDKIDLGIGVYRDDNNQSPVFTAVKAAEQWRVDTETEKAYIGPLGDLGFCDALTSLALGEPLAAELSSRIAFAQTPGGVGALRLAFELLQNQKSDMTLWISDTTWQVHRPIAETVGLNIKTYPYYVERDSIKGASGLSDASRASDVCEDITTVGRRSIKHTLKQLNEAAVGDAILLQASCHNPTGLDFSPQEWDELVQLCLDKQLMPIIDMAYHGLGKGLEAERYGLQVFAQRVPQLLLCYTCSKNFGLYRDRVGMLLVLAENPHQQNHAEKQLMQLATRHYFTPPAHGASLVKKILQDKSLKMRWLAELEQMRLRLMTVRQAIVNGLASSEAAALRDWRFLTDGGGMFALFPLSVAEIKTLKQEEGIYLVDNGRVNLSGLNPDNIALALAAIIKVIDQQLMNPFNSSGANYAN
jgi:aspartate aminotransferase